MKSNGLILLVDDSEFDAELTIDALSSKKLVNKIKWLDDGEKAIEYLKDKSNELPTLVLLDLKMPKVNGIEVLEIIREDPRLTNIPVVILTSSQEESDIVKSYQTGANSYVVKPVDYEQFIRCVEEIGLYWVILNEFASGD